MALVEVTPRSVFFLPYLYFIRSRLEGMAAFKAVPHTHTFMMRAEPVIDDVVRFLGTGTFAD